MEVLASVDEVVDELGEMGVKVGMSDCCSLCGDVSNRAVYLAVASSWNSSSNAILFVVARV